MSAANGLPRSTWHLLRRGDTAGQYTRFGNADHALHAALVHKLRYAGWSAVRIDQALRDDDNAGGVYYRERLASDKDGRRAFRHYIERYVDRQDDLDEHRPIRRRDRSDVFEAAQVVLAAADRVIVGRTRVTDLAGIRVWAEFAVRHSTVVPFISVRDLALGIGSPSRATAQSVRDRLTNRWRLLVEVKSGGVAKAYRPSRWVTTGTDSALNPGEPSVPTLTHPADDCWRQSDLGRSVRVVYEQLTDEPQPLAALVKATRLSRSTVSRALRRLADRRMARKVADGWIRGWVDAATASRHGAAAGHGERDRCRFDRERRAYHNVRVVPERDTAAA